jgi:predicted signal transduction protein with EAL and GGDEF domain
VSETVAVLLLLIYPVVGLGVVFICRAFEFFDFEDGEPVFITIGVVFWPLALLAIVGMVAYRAGDHMAEARNTKRQQLQAERKAAERERIIAEREIERLLGKP